MDVNYKISRQFQSYSNVDTELSVSSLDNIGSTDNQSITMSYEVKLRTKILKNEGANTPSRVTTSCPRLSTCIARTLPPTLQRCRLRLPTC